MAKIKYLVVGRTEEIEKLIRNEIISASECGPNDVVIARFGVNKKALKHIAEKEFNKGK